jgi:hypothetical protein
MFPVPVKQPGPGTARLAAAPLYVYTFIIAPPLLPPSPFFLYRLLGGYFLRKLLVMKTKNFCLCTYRTARDMGTGTARSYQPLVKPTRGRGCVCSIRSTNEEPPFTVLTDIGTRGEKGSAVSLSFSQLAAPVYIISYCRKFFS